MKVMILFRYEEYLGIFSPSTTEVYEPLRKLLSPNCEWTLNNTYQNLYNRAKIIIKKNATMAFYNDKGTIRPGNRCIDVDLGASPL